MLDDGAHRDGEPGDGVYGAELPALVNNSGWTASDSLGGSPETIFRSFVRGNADGGDNGRVNWTDGIFILEHLFRGGLDPPGDDAADVDDDGKLDMTDAIFLLQHLFLVGATASPPYPEKGVDPTTDDPLSCRG